MDTQRTQFLSRGIRGAVRLLTLSTVLYAGSTAAAFQGVDARKAAPQPSQPGTRIGSGRDDPAAVAALSGLAVPLEVDRQGNVRWIEAVKAELTDEAMAYLPRLPMLEWLEIGGGSVTPAGFATLRNCRGLRRLYVHDIRINDDSLAALSRLPLLEALSLQRTGIAGKGLHHLASLRRLTVLNVSSNLIFDEDLGPVAALSGLEVLGLQNTGVSGAGVKKLEGMQRLNVLNLEGTRIVDADLKHFLAMPNLRIVHAAGCRISDKAVKELSAVFPMLSVFN